MGKQGGFRLDSEEVVVLSCGLVWYGQVSLGSSLQFGYGTGVMNNSEQFIR